MNYKKYVPHIFTGLKDRTWPGNTLSKAPIWCSVDLRDGNQALPVPMSVEKKLTFWNTLVDMGYKDIEIGFPSASETEFSFARKLIDESLIPDGVRIQVLTQSREHLIRKTFEAVAGAKQAIIHLYNSTSVQQREVVFKMTKQEIIDIAVTGAKLIVELEKEYPQTEFFYEYSPESFHATEIDYALEICEAVIEVFQPTPQKKMIINLPTTVEVATPNVFADQVEWFCKNLKDRESIVISVHPHNDRGCAIATSELAMLAGADRVEGTLFGNGERTGNADILAIAMNLYSQGIDPGVKINNIDEIADIYKECTLMDINQRHPYVGELVFTAFSGSHQDAINKGLKAYEAQSDEIWEVPYLPIDPQDIGRSYEPIIRINSQSGKGGVAYVLETFKGYKLPKAMHPEFARFVQKKTDETGKELSPDEIYNLFHAVYLSANDRYRLGKYSISSGKSGEVDIKADITLKGKQYTMKAHGNGPISAFFHGIKALGYNDFSIEEYSEHALSLGADAEAIAYVQVSDGKGNKHFGTGVDSNIDSASMKAILSSLSFFDA
ncbi:MAG: 2-isopropylmalate synthase [Clostridia bacterium]|nr:2-isopropylmalate synthase [Clostridia bacterium]